MVLVPRDGHIPHLSPLYEGPYKVLTQSQRTFHLQVGNRVEVVSVQRLKPAITSEALMKRNQPNHLVVDVLLVEFHQILLLLFQLVLEEDQGRLQPQPRL